MLQRTVVDCHCDELLNRFKESSLIPVQGESLIVELKLCDSRYIRATVIHTEPGTAESVAGGCVPIVPSPTK